MSVAGFPSEQEKSSPPEALGRMRASGGVTARFASAGAQTRIAELHETGGWRLLMPAIDASHAEAVLINTGGGVVGGDRLRFETSLAPGADVVIATQAAERVYRSAGPDTEIDIALRIGDAARLAWLPQETILFSGSRLVRRIEADLSSSSQLLMVEAITFGRIASGEIPGLGRLLDHWRIRRDGRLVFADAVRLEGHVGRLLARPAVAGGGRAVALILLVSPDAEDRIAGLRTVLATAVSSFGASAWNGMLVARFADADPAAVRRDVAHAVRHLHDRDLPRVWAN